MKEVRCHHCDKLLTNKQVKDRLTKSRKPPTNMYCSRNCYEEYRGRSQGNICACGDPMTYGASQCGECRANAVSKYFTNEEVLYLATINPGVGIREFTRNVIKRKDNDADLKNMEMILAFLQFCSEEFGFDYVEWIDDPDKMVTYKLRDLPEEYRTYVEKTQQTTTPESRMAAKAKYRRYKHEGRDTSAFGKVGGKFVKVPPKFTYGDLE